jgi:hypothetical protein
VTEFSVFVLPQGAIQFLYSIRKSIWLDPPYQRVSDIWSPDKRQLLVDSVLNGFDIPKLYFHELVPSRRLGDLLQRYAIIDGKQRLDALWGFIDGKFALAEDFEFLHDDTVQAAGLTYEELGKKYPHLRAQFDATSLAVIAVRTDDVELIEEMFSRLNEAAPLNAPEKRNAFGGTLPPAIRDLASHHYFSHKIPIRDRRYKHRDLAAKYMLIESKDAITDTRKVYLDSFVKDWASSDRSESDARLLRSGVERHLDAIAMVFVDSDPLLRSIGMNILIFHFFRLLGKTGSVDKVSRSHFELFDKARQANRLAAQLDLSGARYDLMEFDKYAQTTHDAFAHRIRLGILVRFMRDEGRLNIPDTHDEYFALLGSGT